MVWAGVSITFQAAAGIQQLGALRCRVAVLLATRSTSLRSRPSFQRRRRGSGRRAAAARMTRTPAATHSRPRVRGGWDGPAGLEVDQSCLARTQCAGVDVRFEFQGLTRFLVTVDPHTSLHALTDPPIAHAGVKVAVRRFLGNFDEAGFLTEDAAADQALSGVDPREAARRAADPINAIDIPAAGGRGSWAAAGVCVAVPPWLSGP